LQTPIAGPGRLRPGDRRGHGRCRQVRPGAGSGQSLPDRLV